MREIVRLHQAGVSTRQIGIRIGVAASTVRLTLRRVSEAGLSGRAAIEQTDTALEALLFSRAGKKTGHRRHADPDWALIHQELRRKHVTLTIYGTNTSAKRRTDTPNCVIMLPSRMLITAPPAAWIALYSRSYRRAPELMPMTIRSCAGQQALGRAGARHGPSSKTSFDGDD